MVELKVVGKINHGFSLMIEVHSRADFMVNGFDAKYLHSNDPSRLKISARWLVGLFDKSRFDTSGHQSLIKDKSNCVESSKEIV